ncbi:MAG: hypothetical protein ACYS1A_10695 [Planctomycetota bacterium]|jgi:hypothetical protein
MSKLKITFLFVILCACSIIKANTTFDNMLTEDQVAKLVAAAWQSPPSSLDVTLYKELTKPAMSIEQIRINVQKVFDATEDGAKYRMDIEGDIKNRNAEIEQEINRIAKEQQSPRVLKQQIRIMDHYYRLDQTIVKPGMQVEQEMAYEQTFVNSGDPSKGDYTHFDYDHNRKIATIYGSKSMWRRDKILDLATMPMGAHFLIQAFLGEKMETPTGDILVPDNQKMRKLAMGDIDNLNISISSEGIGPDARDHIMIRVPKVSSNNMIVITCDRDDYSRVYRFESHNPQTGQLMFVRECEDFDSQGFPHNATMQWYDKSGKIVRKENWAVEEVKLNSALAKDLFSFHIPSNYGMVDRRLEKPFVVQPVPSDVFAPQLSESKNIIKTVEAPLDRMAHRKDPVKPLLTVKAKSKNLPDISAGEGFSMKPPIKRDLEKNPVFRVISEVVLTFKNIKLWLVVIGIIVISLILIAVIHSDQRKKHNNT